MEYQQVNRKRYKLTQFKQTCLGKLEMSDDQSGVTIYSMGNYPFHNTAITTNHF